MAKKVCDFCLSEMGGLFNRPEKLSDGHYICKNCRQIISEHGLPVKYDIFQRIVTAQPHMKDMIMDTYLETNKPEDVIARLYPLPKILLHEGEHCINAIRANLRVSPSSIPNEYSPRSIVEVRKSTINNIPDAVSKKESMKIEGMLYETEAAVYFMSEHIINCHRLGYVVRNTNDTDKIKVVTPTKTFTYAVENAEMFFIRERFYQKVNAAKNHKDEHLIYIKNDNELRITPGVYDIPRSLRPGIYQVKALKDAGLHVKDSLGRITDYYETEDSIDLSNGGTLEVTGEYELKWIGEKR